MSTVAVDGLATFQATMRDAADQLHDMTQPHTEATAQVASRAAGTAPRLSGALAAGHRTVARPDVGFVYNPQPYAAPIHWGWPRRGIRAQPWLSETATATEAAWLDAYTDHAQAALDTVKGA